MIDWDRLIDLRNDIGAESFTEVAALFVAELQETLDRLLGAPETANASDFHFLRGSAANLGFVAMADACEVEEARCKDNLAPDVAKIARVFEASLDVATRQVPELAAA